IREKAPQVAVIVLTGSEDPRLIRAAIAAGAQDYQIKGIFPKGHLARALEAAARRQAVESRLLRGELPEAELLEPLTALNEGVAVLANQRIVLANPAFARLTGSPQGPTECPSWLTTIAQEVSAGGASSGSTSPVPSCAMGELSLPGPGGVAVDLEYVLRRFPGAAGHRVLVRVRESMSSRRTPPGGATEPSAAPSPPPPTVSPVAPPSPLDAEAWVQLRELAGPDATFLPALVDAFLAESRLMLHRLKVAADRGDAIAVSQSAHNLKSGCAQVGALALSRRCAELERSASAGELDPMRSSLEHVLREFPAVEQVLTAMRRST
ncbi:MAG: response regulator, partial [Thermoplasmata archaeon]